MLRAIDSYRYSHVAFCLFSDASQDELIAKAERIRSSLKSKTKAKSQCTAALKTYSRGVEAALQAVEKLESAEKVCTRYIYPCMLRALSSA